jgi:peptidyl-dipeptidase A
VVYTSPHRLVELLGERLEEAETEFHRAYWESQTVATPDNEARRAKKELEVRRIKGDAEALAAVQESLEEPHDPYVKRQLEVLRLSLAANQMSDEERTELVQVGSAVEGAFATFRPDVDGRPMSENDIEEILRTSDDEELRRRVWMASKEIGAEVGTRVRELARLRNTIARRQGYLDHYRMSLEFQELPEEWLFDVLDELDRLTSEPFASWKQELDQSLRHRFSVDDLYPWHYADPFFQNLPPGTAVSLDSVLRSKSAPELVAQTFSGWGIDLRGVLSASDLRPRDLKCQHAFCLDIDRSGSDVRILANVVPGEQWIEVLLHEAGHAAYDVGIDPNLPWLLRRAAHTFVTEAIAILCGSLMRDPEWLVQVASVPRREVDDLAEFLRRAETAQRLIFIRWGLVVAHFERNLYSDPEGDLDAIWWELVERFQLLSRPQETRPDAWASKIHLAVAPAYYHNYLLGEMLAHQLRGALEAACGSFVGNPLAGEFLMDRIFRHGALTRWDALIESATGRALGASDLAAAVSN